MISAPSPSYEAAGKHDAPSDFSKERMFGRSFTSRLLRLVFKQGHVRLARSWPKRAKATSVPTLSANQSYSSVSIAIPSHVSSPVPSYSSNGFESSNHTADDDSTKAAWRQRQTQCANCERLFFKSMSTLSSGAYRFCSLDCMANLKYLGQLQSMLYMEESDSAYSSGSWTQSNLDRLVLHH